MRASSASTCFTYGQCTQMNMTSRPFLAASSLPMAFPVTTSGNSNAGATVPNSTMADCVLDIKILPTCLVHHIYPGDTGSFFFQMAGNQGSILYISSKRKCYVT